MEMVPVIEQIKLRRWQALSLTFIGDIGAIAGYVLFVLALQELNVWKFFASVACFIVFNLPRKLGERWRVIAWVAEQEYKRNMRYAVIVTRGDNGKVLALRDHFEPLGPGERNINPNMNGSFHD